MPFTVDQLITEHQKLITVSRDATIEAVLELMIEHDFNQLPVVDSDQTLLGMVTGDSVLRAMKNFGTTVKGLLVSHAIIAADKHFRDDDLFELLDDLRDAYAVVIVDGEDKAVGIVTSYDTTEYFQRRAQDMMFVEDIESTLKEYISSAFTNAEEELDEAARAAAVLEATSSDADARKQFNKALGHYLNAVGITAKLNPNEAKAVFDSDFPKSKPKSFEDLSLGEFNQMLIHDSTWPKVCGIFSLDKEAISSLLDQVRKTRNELFHFRGEISPNQRAQLQFCADWLNRQRPTPTASSPKPELATVSGSTLAPTDLGVPFEAQEAVDRTNSTAPDLGVLEPQEETGPSNSRYAGLARYLQALSSAEGTVLLTFEQVEAIIGDRLPMNARQHRSWWANDSVSHSQSQRWLEAGWRVNRISIADQKVSFARNRDRERLYINFFSAAIANLERVDGFPLKATSPSGQSWQTVAVLPKSGTQQAIFTLAFAFRGRFRVELYIDTWDERGNKAVFDQLLEDRELIEAAVGGALSWERLDSRRASRIALHHAGSITDIPSELEELRVWVSDAMPRLYRGLAERTEAALAKSLKPPAP